MSESEKEESRKKAGDYLDQLRDANYLKLARQNFAALEAGFNADSAEQLLEKMDECLEKLGADIRALDLSKQLSYDDMNKKLKTAWEDNMKQNAYLRTLDGTRRVLSERKPRTRAAARPALAAVPPATARQDDAATAAPQQSTGAICGKPRNLARQRTDMALELWLRKRLKTANLQ